MFYFRILMFCSMIPIYQCMFGTSPKETLKNQLTKGILDETAEIQHFNRRFGFVNYRKNGIFDIKKYLELAQGHEIELELWTPELWQYMVKEVTNMKIRYCEDTLKDPLLQENNITFDENADEEFIRLVTKEVVFFRYKKMPSLDYLVKCPITVQGKDGFFAYITLFERTEQEKKEDFYFILFDFYHEDIQDPTSQVVIAMRTKLGARVPILQRMGTFLKNSFNSVKRRLEAIKE